MKIELTEKQMKSIIDAAEICGSEGLGSREFYDLAWSIYQQLYPVEEEPWWYRGLHRKVRK